MQPKIEVLAEEKKERVHRHRVVQEPPKKDLRTVSRRDERSEEWDEAEEWEPIPPKAPPTATPKVVESSKKESMKGLKTTFMLVVMVAVLGIWGTVLYSSFLKTKAGPVTTTSPSVPAEVKMTASVIGSNRFNRNIQFSVSGETTGYVLLIDPLTGNSESFVLVNGQGGYLMPKDAPDMNVMVFNPQGKTYTWKISELLGGK